MSDDTPRWRYRFKNFERAFILLRDAMDKLEASGLTQLEKEGFIQRFEYTMELSWKVMKDYLEAQGIVFDQITPRAVIRKAFEAKIISDGETWMAAIDARNKMSHTYDLVKFEEVIEKVRRKFHASMDEFYTFLLDKYMEKE